jgi:hypothetical protein
MTTRRQSGIGDLDVLEVAAAHMKVLDGRRDHVPQA